MGDFGLAYVWDDPDATANALGPIGPLGTPRYMAPEQVGAGREPLGPAADVYGLGALLYHIMTGRPPFVAPSVAETLEQVRHQEPVPPRRLNPAIPRDLETICLKCLRKEPGQRYGSARSVADELRRLLDGVAIAARPVSAPEKTWRWCRRRPAVAALAAALVVTLFAGFLGMFVLWRHAVSERGRADFQRDLALAAQTRAEADFRRLAELLDQMVELSVGGQRSLPKVVSPERKTGLLQGMRQQLIDLGPRLPNHEAMAFQLMSVNERLRLTLSEQKRWDEVRSLLEQSLRESEDAIQRFPRAAFARSWRASHLGCLASVAERQGKMAESRGPPSAGDRRPRGVGPDRIRRQSPDPPDLAPPGTRASPGRAGPSCRGQGPPDRQPPRFRSVLRTSWTASRSWPSARAQRPGLP